MDGAEMLRNIFQFEKGHSGFTWRRTVAALRVLFLRRREQALNYRACGQSMIPARINAAPREKTFCMMWCNAPNKATSYFSAHIR
jgi:hypothetical protein